MAQEETFFIVHCMLQYIIKTRAVLGQRLGNYLDYLTYSKFMAKFFTYFLFYRNSLNFGSQIN